MADVSGFDANAPENNQKSVLPAGEYDVICVKSERKQTKDGLGAYLNCEFKVTRGEYQNRTIFHKFNLWLTKDKQQAIDIAKGQFSEFCRAVSVPTPKDSSELHNKPLAVKINAKESKDYGVQNNVTKFSARQVVGVTRQVEMETVSAAPSNGPW